MKDIFNKEYRFKGQHAARVVKLTALFDEKSKAKLFSRNIDVYINAPIIGFLYGRLANVDDTKNPETGQTYTQHILRDMVMTSSSKLLFNYQLIMLLDENYEPDKDKRISKAFRYGEDPADEEHFNCYVRGGIDVLYEKLIEDANNSSDFISKLAEFLEDFQNKYNSGIENSDILSYCVK